MAGRVRASSVGAVTLRFVGPEDAREVPGVAGPVLAGGECVVAPQVADGLLQQSFTDPATGEVRSCFVEQAEQASAGKRG